MLDERTEKRLEEQGRLIARFELFLKKASKVMNRQASEVSSAIRKGYEEEKKKIKE